MIKIFQYCSAWNLPDTSPFVTKLVNYMVMTGLEYELIPQDLARLREDAPTVSYPISSMTMARRSQIRAP